LLSGSHAREGWFEPASKASGPGTENLEESANRAITLNEKQTASASPICWRSAGSEDGAHVIRIYCVLDSWRSRRSERVASKVLAGAQYRDAALTSDLEAHFKRDSLLSAVFSETG
jgi:hypothetical protein